MIKIENRLEAWLAFLCMDAPEDIVTIIEKYPDFKEMYEEVYDVCRNLEEVMGMFSKELLELDRNTAQLMIDEMEKEITEKKQELADKKQELTDKKQELADKKQELADKKQELADKKQELAEKQQELTDSNKKLLEKDQTIAELLKKIELLEKK